MGSFKKSQWNQLQYQPDMQTMLDNKSKCVCDYAHPKLWELIFMYGNKLSSHGL